MNITDIFAGALAIPREKAAEVEAGVRALAREEMKSAAREDVVEAARKSVEKAMPSLVEREVATELKHLATREDLLVLDRNLREEMHNLREELKVDMHKMENKLVLWMVGILVAIFVAALSLVTTMKSTAPQIIEVSRQER